MSTSLPSGFTSCANITVPAVSVAPYWIEKMGPSLATARLSSGTGTGAAAVTMFRMLDKSASAMAGESSSACSIADTTKVKVMRSDSIAARMASASKPRCSTTVPACQAACKA